MTAIKQVQKRVLEHFGPDFEIGKVVAMRQTTYNSVRDVSYTGLQR